MEIEKLYEIFKSHPHVTTDTRKCTPGSLFFALKGDNFDGNQFAKQALDSGCAYAVVDNPGYVDGERYLLVEDTLTALQHLAICHRRQFDIPVIGITGTNGKTTTKELTSAALGTRYRVLCTEGNLNNHIGVPLTLLRLTAEHEIAVVEMGASHPGDIKELVSIAEPGYGLITNVGKGHLEGFGSFEGVVRTKCELYDYLRNHGGHVFVDHENCWLLPRTLDIERTGYGQDPGLFVSGRLIDCSPFLSLDFTCKGETNEVKTHLVGNYNLSNVLAAASIAAYFGVDNQDIARAIADYEPQNKRSQLQKTERNLLVLDAYNANPTSMAAAIENFKMMNFPNKAVILGDMLELGNESETEHKKIIELLQSSGFDKVLLSGSEFLKANDKGFLSFADTDELAGYLKDNTLGGYIVLVKGSRGMQLEKCIVFL